MRSGDLCKENGRKCGRIRLRLCILRVWIIWVFKLRLVISVVFLLNILLIVLRLSMKNNVVFVL